MNRLLVTLLASSALVGLSTAAHATILTQAVQVTFAQALTDYTGTGTLALFDSNLGTLDSIQLSDTFSETSTVTATNNTSGTGALASNGSVNTSSALTVGSTNSTIAAIIRAQLGTNSGLNPNGGYYTASVLGAEYDYTLAPGASSGGDSSSGPVTKSAVDSSSADLAPFEVAGGGAVTLTDATFTKTVLSNNGGNTQASQVTQAGGYFQVIYTYDDSTAVTLTPPPTTVPEPASMALLGAGLLGAGLVRRHR